MQQRRSRADVVADDDEHEMPGEEWEGARRAVAKALVARIGTECFPVGDGPHANGDHSKYSPGCETCVSTGAPAKKHMRTAQRIGAASVDLAAMSRSGPWVLVAVARGADR